MRTSAIPAVIDRASTASASDYLFALALDHDRPDAHADDPAWFNAFRMAASIHGLGPFLGLRVEQGDLDVPDPLADWLLTQVARNRIRLGRLRHDLLAVLAGLTAEGVAPVPLKGAALLLSDIESIAWRPMSDLDLLVPHRDPQSLDSVLADLGYCVHSIGWKHRRYTRCVPGPAPVVGDGEHPDHPRDLEVHPRVVELFRGIRWDLTAIMLNGPMDGRNAPFPVHLPMDSAMSIHLGVHASVHLLVGTSRTIQLIDLVRSIDRSGSAPLIDAVRAAGIDQHARFLYPALAITGRLTRHPDCQQAASLLAPWVSPAMRTWASSIAVAEIAGGHDETGGRRTALWARGPHERIAMLGYALFPGVAHRQDVMRLNYAEHYRRQLRRLQHHAKRAIERR